MKKAIITLQLLLVIIFGYSQADDTLSTNIFQDNGNLGIGAVPTQLLQLESEQLSGFERNLLGIHNTSTNGLAYAGLTLKTGAAAGYSVIQDYGLTYNASPGYDFAGFLNIGNSARGIMFNAGAADGVIKMNTVGVERMRIDFDGNIGIGTIMPEAKLHLHTDGTSDSDRTLMRLHNTSTSGLAFTSIKLYTGDGSKFSAISDMGLTYNASPGYDLAGFLSLTNYARGVILHASSAEGVIKMYTGHDESAGAGIERLRIDSEGNVGIGTLNPEWRFQVNDANARVMMGSHPEYDGPFVNLYGSETGVAPMMTFGVANKDYIKWEKTILKENWGHIYGNDLTEGFALIPSGNSGFPNGLFIDKNANVGIGTDTPQAKLHVADGDIYISDIDKGIIMKSPDGQCWRGVLDNSGQLSFSQVDCPEDQASSSVESQSTTNEASVTIFPNPTSGEVLIETLGTELLSYEMYSVNGNLLEKSLLNTQYSKFDLSTYPVGSYFIRVTDKNNKIVKTQEIVKK